MKVSDILGNRTELPTVYVLMRLFCPELERYKSFLVDIRGALKSVEVNGRGYANKIVLLVNDDTENVQDSKYGEYIAERNKCLDGLGVEWRETESEGGEGSSMSMYRLRKLFVDVAEANDIAICLDQDDELQPNAVNHIAQCMKSNDVGICRFDVIDREGLDITGDKGELHNALARKLRRRCYSERFLNGKCRKGAADLSSIGWTKVYKKSILNEYVANLERLLNSRAGVEAFFRKYTAYEDFLDYYVFLLQNIRITGIKGKTHNYIKNSNSITSKPCVEDFSETRTTMLMTLIDLCYSSKCLCDDFRPKLLRFIASKTFQIDAILEKYRKEFIEDGMENYAIFSAKTYVDYFVSTFYNKVQQEGGNSLDNFKDLMSGESYKAVAQYTDLIKESSPEQLLRKTADIERRMRSEKKYPIKQCLQWAKGRMRIVRNWVRVKVLCKEELKDRSLMSGNHTPHQLQYRILNGIVVVTVLSLFWIVYYFSRKDNQMLFKEYDVAVTVAGSIIVSIITLMINEKSKVKVILDNEKSTARLFYSEFEDFIRHLEANVKVMYQIRKELDEKGNCQIEDIHFDNLVWPESSILFSNEMAKLIARERVDDFSRLKVNIRNVNNSAKWLKRQARSGGDIIGALDWEITRCFGYLVNLYYMNDNDFSFPSQDVLERYIHENFVKNKLTTLFLSEPDTKVREDKVEYYIGRYYRDRRVERAVLVNKL